MHARQPARSRFASGFTLIELSIVLVIIGLIVGGVLVGQDLIRAAGVRATIAQIEKYNTAVNTFRDKYSALPGDMNATAATQFGFAARGTAPGEGDGNGIIQGPTLGFGEMGETALFWVDLSHAGLIDSGFHTATAVPVNQDITGVALDAWFPQAKLGGGNYVYVWAGGYAMRQDGSYSDGRNYFGISAVTKIIGTSMAEPASNAGISVQAAYGIDQKMDDGLPQSGRVLALFPQNDGSSSIASWAAGGGLEGDFSWDVNNNRAPTTGPTPYAATNCYDDNNVAGPERYSLLNSATPNCNISIMFQ